MSYKNHFQFQNTNTASWLKIRVDSIFIEQPVLSYKSERIVWENDFTYNYFFLRKTATAQTRCSRLSDC